MCQRTKYKNCSCKVCKRRSSKHKKILMERHRSLIRQKDVCYRSRGLVPTFETLQEWFGLH
jgi:hypothetical protein